MSDMEISRFQIAKLELRPGDILVLRTHRRISAETAERMRKACEGAVPAGQKILILDDGLDLAVLTREEIIARAA